MTQQYPYAPGNRLSGFLLNHDFELSVGATPPSGGYIGAASFGAGRYRQWMDISTNPATLRIATAARATAGVYVASEWATVGLVDLVKNQFIAQPSHVGVNAGPNGSTTSLNVGQFGHAPPANSGTAQSAGHIARFSDDTGASFDFGGNGGIGMWIDITNNQDLSQHYPLQLNPLGGPVTMGGDLTVGGNATVNGTLSSGTLSSGTVITDGGGFKITGTGHTIYDAGGGPGGRALGFTAGTTSHVNYFVMYETGDFEALNGSVIGGTLKAWGSGDPVRSNTQSGMSNNYWRFATPSGDDVYAGGISYRLGFDANAMAIVGAGTSTGNRLVHIFDNLTVDNHLVAAGADINSINAPGGINTGPITAASVNVSGNIGTNGFIQSNITGGATAFYAPSGNFVANNSVVSNDCAASGVFRRSFPAGSGAKGAMVECWAGSWDAMSFAMTGGLFQVSPDHGASGYTLQPINSFSDARLKENICDSEIDALELLRQTPVRAFEWNDEGRKLMPYVGASEPCGLVAQEIQEIIPGAVGSVPLSGDALYIRNEQLTPYLIRAIQQIADRLDAGGL